MPQDSTVDSPNISWDNSQLREHQDFNFCNVTHSDSALSVVFGYGTPAAGGIQVSVRERIWIRPVVAKLLRDLLQRTVAEFELRHGVVTEGYKPVEGSQTLPNVTGVASFPEPMLPPAALLAELVRNLHAQHELERSVKISPGFLSNNRLLMGVPLGALGKSATIRLPVMWKRLGMPEAFSAQARKSLPTADFVHFGFEAGETGNLYKLYLEQTSTLAAHGDCEEPRLLYTGFKWNPEQPIESAISLYWAFSKLPAERIEARMSALLEGALSAPCREACAALLQLALDRVSAESLLYMEVTEEGNDRHSFDLNLYEAKLQLTEVYPILMSVGRALQVPLAELRRAYDEGKHCTLGHISAGRNREGKPFFTFYYGGHTARA